MQIDEAAERLRRLGVVRRPAAALGASIRLAAALVLSGCGHSTQQATYEISAPAGTTVEVSWTNPDSPQLQTQMVSSGSWSRAVSGSGSPLILQVSATLQPSETGAFPPGTVRCKIVEVGSVIVSGTGTGNRPANTGKSISN
ncbi:MAG: hypothetical protein WAM30_20045 [Candidatus Dormiibacterota bacterium]